MPRFAFSASVFFSVLLALLLSQSVLAEAPQAVQKTRLALNWKPEPQFGGFYAAEVAGAFKRRELEVKILPGGSGTPVVQMVAAGTVEFGVASGDEIVLSRANGTDVVALFAAYQTNPQALMVRPERKVANVRELLESAGPLAMQKGLPYARFLFKKYPKMKADVVPYLGGITGFLVDPNYAQQCFATSEPLSAKKQGHDSRVFLIADEGFNPYTTVLIARESTLKAKPALVKAMVDAVREGWRAYLDNPTAANAVMEKLNPAMDAATFLEGAKAQVALIETIETKASGLGKMTAGRWTALGKQMQAIDLLKEAPAAASLFRDF